MFSKTEEIWLRAYTSALTGSAVECDYNTNTAIYIANKAVDDFCDRFGYEKERIEGKL